MRGIRLKAISPCVHKIIMGIEFMDSFSIDECWQVQKFMLRFCVASSQNLKITQLFYLRWMDCLSVQSTTTISPMETGAQRQPISLFKYDEISCIKFMLSTFHKPFFKKEISLNIFLMLSPWNTNIFISCSIWGILSICLLSKSAPL